VGCDSNAHHSAWGSTNCNLPWWNF
jgi:hypothetical protein